MNKPSSFPPQSGFSGLSKKSAILGVLSILLVGAGLFFGARAVRQMEFVGQEQAASQSVPVSVAATAAVPVSLAIPALSLNSVAVVPLGLNRDGSLQVPTGDKSDREVGWYSGGAVPGAAGAAIMVGHLDSALGPAVFWNLKKLVPGDLIRIARSDGSTVQFKVDHSASYGIDNFPDNEVYGATPYPSLRLLTCAGVYNREKHHYTENLVVYAGLSK